MLESLFSVINVNCKILGDWESELRGSEIKEAKPEKMDQSDWEWKHPCKLTLKTSQFGKILKLF